MKGSRAPFVLACLTACFLHPLPTQVQTGFFVRLAPEVSVVAVEHTKTVTIGGGSSTSISSSSGFGTAVILTGGFRSAPSAGWMFGSELEVVVPSPRLIKGTIDPTNSGNPHDVWAGRWEFSDKFGMGAACWSGEARTAGTAGSTCSLECAGRGRNSSPAAPTRRPASRARTGSGSATGP